jgi:uncharacterized phage protein (TIGR01671 family)
MREILFRGKRIDNGEWVEGFYVDGAPMGNTWILHVHTGHPEHLTEWFAVNPSTIGQFTGLCDKNGKKVFMGDIVNCSRGCPHEVVWLGEYGGTYVGGMPCIYLSGLREGYAWTGSEEIIGNIHDTN